MKIQLVGARRYNKDGELFLSHHPDGRTPMIYIVADKKGEYLLDQTDPQSGYAYFEAYEGPEEGQMPGMAQDDERAPRRERPKENERQRRRRLEAEAAGAAAPAGRRGHGPRGNEATMSERQGRQAPSRMPARETAPIEEGDAVTV